MKQINLLLRFLLEIAALVIVGTWGWNQTTGLFQYLFVAGLPVLFATLWGVFAVPGDPSRSGKSVVPVPGWFRLIIELILLGFAAWAIFDLGHRTFGLIFTVLLVFHYITFIERLKWLVRH
jgi:hypothetical protein